MFLSKYKGFKAKILKTIDYMKELNKNTFSNIYII